MHNVFYNLHIYFVSIKKNIYLCRRFHNYLTINLLSQHTPMKRLYIFCFSILLSLSLFAKPFFVRVNGTDDYPATKTDNDDFQGRTQYCANCVALKAGDVLTCYDQGGNAEWAIPALDQYGAASHFTIDTQGLTCHTAGSYNIYIKIMYKDDMWYIEEAQDCTTPPDPIDPTDPTDPSEPSTYATSVPAECGDVMLQAFYWDSYQKSGLKHGTTRWTNLAAEASEIAAYFDLVWLPPSAKASGVGYHPAQYCNQNSAWGNRAELETLISNLHTGGAKVIADIVINHTDNKSSWCDFYPEDFGEFGSFEPTPAWICRTDEMNSSAAAGACKGKATGAADDGYGNEANYGAARDWDHTNAEVRKMFCAYLKWMKAEMKYDGWRYDYCKGFHNSHIDEYNKAAGNYFSVMEYWDGNKDVLWSRIQEAGSNTLTFDFGTKYDAFNNSMAAGNYSGCKAPGLLGIGKGKYAVTFVDSHDTYQRDNNEFGGKGNSMTSGMKPKVLQANAFILSMPGVPCIFYPHWKEYKEAIAPMILARQAVGVHSESSVSDEADASGYRATVTGKNGTLILELGNRVSASKSGYTKAAAGTGYAIWIKTNKAVAPKLVITPGSTTFKTETLRVEMKTVGGTETAEIFYTTDGTAPRTSATRVAAGNEVSFTINNTTTLMAYAASPNTQTPVQTYTYTRKEPQTTPIIVSFYKPASWQKVYLYSWTGTGTSVKEHTAQWPGTELTQKNADGFYFYQFDATVKEVNFIFNAGKDKEQTSDLWTDEDVCYAWSAGAEKLLPDCIYTAIDQVESESPMSLDMNAPMYNILGMLVDATYRGIVIQNGHKFLLQ